MYMPDLTRALVTGVTGFVGCHLARALLERPELQVQGLSLSSAWQQSGEDLSARVALMAGDLCDTPRVIAVLREFQPTQIYHLAGYAEVGSSFAEPDAAWRGNLKATR